MLSYRKRKLRIFTWKVIAVTNLIFSVFLVSFWRFERTRTSKVYLIISLSNQVRQRFGSCLEFIKISPAWMIQQIGKFQHELLKVDCT